MFVVPLVMSSGRYRTPQRGYPYFQLAPGNELAARKDWNELKRVAGTGMVVGFGQYWVAHPNDPEGNPHHSLEVTVHVSSDDRSALDAEPLSQAQGVVEVKSQNKEDPHAAEIAAQLREAVQH